MKEKAASSNVALGCLAAFLLPFFAFGIFMFVMGLKKAFEGERQGWAFAGFGLAFTSFAAVLHFFARKGLATVAKRRQIAAARPEEPWTWREDWAAGRIESGERGAVFSAWVFTLIWNAVSAPVFFFLPRELAKGNYAVLVALLFPLIGLGLLIWAVRAAVQARKFGRSLFLLRTMPGVIGGTLEGVVKVSAKIRPTAGFRLRLVSLRRVTTGSGKNRSTHESVLWEEEKVLLHELLADDPRTTGVPVFFAIPASCEPVSDTAGADVVWRLEVRAAVPGVDYRAHFEVPVFRIATATDDPPAPRPAPAEPLAPPADSRIKVQTTHAGAREFIFPAARNPASGCFLLVFTAIWSGALWFMIRQKAPILFPIVWAFFDTVLVLFLIDLWLKATRVTIDAKGLTLSKSWLFFRRERKLAASDVKTIDIQIGMTSGSTAYYDLKIVTTAGRKITAASAIKNKREVEWLAQEMNAALKTEPR